MHTLVGFKPRVPVYGTLNCLIKCINATAPSSPVLKSGSHWCTLHFFSFLTVWLFCFCLDGGFFFVCVLNKSKFYYTSSFATQILNTKKQQQQHVFTHVG